MNPNPRPKDCRGVSDKRTICEVHRELYDIAVTQLRDAPCFKDITDRLEEAYLMGKKMNAKLRQYKYDYDEGWWEQTANELIHEKQTLRGVR